MLIIYKRIFISSFFNFISLALLILFTFHHSAIAADNYELGESEIYVNPLGLLQFGPIFGAGFKADPNIMIGGHFRYTAMGAATWIIHALDDEEPGLDSFAVGIDIKYFFDNQNKSPHRMYMGGTIEYGKGSYTGDDGWDEWEGEYTEVVIVGNMGYRWRFASGLFLNAGGYFGFAIDLDNEWWYTDDKSDKYDSKGTTLVLMAEFTIGKEF